MNNKMMRRNYYARAIFRITSIRSIKVISDKTVYLQSNHHYHHLTSNIMKFLPLICLGLFVTATLNAQKPRARDIGIPFNGIPGKFNAITDVKGVEVGFS